MAMPIGAFLILRRQRRVVSCQNQPKRQPRMSARKVLRSQWTRMTPASAGHCCYCGKAMDWLRKRVALSSSTTPGGHTASMLRTLHHRQPKDARRHQPITSCPARIAPDICLSRHPLRHGLLVMLSTKRILIAESTDRIEAAKSSTLFARVIMVSSTSLAMTHRMPRLARPA